MHLLITIPDKDVPEGLSTKKLRKHVAECVRGTRLDGSFDNIEVAPLDEVGLCVVARGSAFDGITLEGPFIDEEEATRYADDDCLSDWHVVKIESPE